MLVEILAVVDGSLLDFVDGLIDFVNGLLLLFTQFAAIGTLQMGASVAKIRQSVKISRMLPRRQRCCGNYRGYEEQNRGNREHQFAKAFHLTSSSYSNELDLRKTPSG